MKFQGSLAEYLLDNTTSDIYYRGLDYMRKGKVRDFNEETKKVKAKIAGTQDYYVEIRRGQIYTEGHCDCPYAQTNSDYCKHVIALAVYYDELRKVLLPTPKDVKKKSMEVDHSFGSKIDEMFKDPMNADLELLATASDYASWVRPHARIVLTSALKIAGNKLTKFDVRKAFSKIRSLGNKYKYDPYFCAGELSAVSCLTLDEILKNLGELDEKELVEVFIESVVFYYNTYLAMIDGSDGIWQIPQARIIKMFEILKSRVNDDEKIEDIRETLNEKIEGWGDIFDDLRF